MTEKEIESVAIPPLGCGQGGLNWSEVKAEIETALSDLKEVNIIVFEPSEKVKEILRKQDSKKKANLTPVRAMLLYLLFHYRRMGEFATEFAAEKLSYFLQRFGERQLKLDFEKGYYGPYSGKVRHVLYALNGTYLHGYEGKDLKPFEPFKLEPQKFGEIKNYINKSLSKEEKQRLEKVLDLSGVLRHHLPLNYWLRLISSSRIEKERLPFPKFLRKLRVGQIERKSCCLIKILK